MGFVSEELNETEKSSIQQNKVNNMAVVYGKEASMWKVHVNKSLFSVSMQNKPISKGNTKAHTHAQNDLIMCPYTYANADNAWMHMLNTCIHIHKKDLTDTYTHMHGNSSTASCSVKFKK